MAGATRTLRAAMTDTEKSSNPFQRQMAKNGAETDKFAKAMRRAEPEIDRLSGRVSILRDTLVLVGPGMLPIAAMAVPAIAGLANAFGAAALGAGALMVASQGVGDAVGALEAFRDDPSAANAEKLAEAFEKIGPEAREFATAISDKALPALKQMRDQAAAGGLPWLTKAIDDLDELEPKVSGILRAVASATGEALAGGMESLNSDRWSGFFSFLQAEAPGTISKLAEVVGNVTHGLAGMWMAFTPTNNSFMNWLVDATQTFDEWSQGLSQSQGFHEFIDYLQSNGPKVAEFAGSLVNAFVQVSEAVAPFGGPVLTILTKFLDVVAKIADSELGTPLFGLAAGLAAMNRTLAATRALGGGLGAGEGGILATLGISERANRRMTTFRESMRGARTDIAAMGAAWSPIVARTAGEQRRFAESARSLRTNLGAAGREAGRVAGPIAGLAVASSGVADSFGLSNTASLALAGTMAGPWGAAAGAAVGMTMDLVQANNRYQESLQMVNSALGSGSLTNATAGLSQARSEYQKYTDSIAQGSDLIKNALNPALTVKNFKSQMLGIKNSVEGLFGKSDVEEAQAEFEAAEQSVRATESAVRDLAAAMNVPITGSATSQMQQLDQVLASAQPAMEKLGYTTEQYIASATSGAQWREIFHLPSTDKMNADIAATTQHMYSVQGRSEALGQSFAGLSNQMLPPAERARALGAALDSLVGPQINAVNATDSYYASLQQLQGMNLRAGFEGQNEAVRANRAAMNGAVQALQQRIALEAAANPNGNFIQMLARGRQELVRNGRAAGASSQQVNRYLNQLNLTPKSIITAIRQSGMSAAKKRTAELNFQYSRLPRNIRTIVRAMVNKNGKVDIDRLQKKVGKLSKTEARIIAKINDRASKGIGKVDSSAKKMARARKITVSMNDNTAGKRAAIDGWQPSDKSYTVTQYQRTVKKNADGGFHTAMRANGGYDAKMLGSGPTLYMWREPETRGESFIPHADDHRRPGAKRILEQTANLFGGQVVWNALGNYMGAARMQPITPASAATVVAMGGAATVTLDTPWGSQEVEVMMRELARDEIDAEAAFRRDHRQGG